MVYQNRKQHRKERAQYEGKRGERRQAALRMKRMHMAEECLEDHESIDNIMNVEVVQPYEGRKREKRQTRMRMAVRRWKDHESREQL